MSELKCPFCQQELKELYNNGNSVGFRCKNKNCPETNIMCGTKALWQELIRTRKALDVARHTIGWINQMIDEHVDKQAIKIKCEYALEQITAEQKDN